MRFLQFFLVLLFSINLVSCASEMPGLDAIEVSPPTVSAGSIEVAMDEIDSLSSGEYRAFNVSVRNNADTWLRIDKVNIAFPTQEIQPEVLLDKDLQSYATSIKRRNGVAQYNKALALDTIYLIGTIGSIAASSSGDINLAINGLGVGLGALTYGAIDKVINSKNKAEFQDALPDNHLLKAFDVPPGMIVSRWIIVKLVGGKDYRGARIELTERNQPKRNFVVTTNKIRTSNDRSSYP